MMLHGPPKTLCIFIPIVIRLLGEGQVEIWNLLQDASEFKMQDNDNLIQGYPKLL